MYHGGRVDRNQEIAAGLELPARVGRVLDYHAGRMKGRETS
jgi:hypothetical protein